MRKPVIVTTLVALALSCLPAKAQPPLFAGYNGPQYALESRVNQDRQITEVGKTFRTEIPAWAYVGVSSDDFKKPFYGVGPRIEIGRVHTLPTVEGYDGNFTGVSGYSTLDLSKRWYLDLVPHFDSGLDYTRTEFTLHRDVKGFSLGAGSEVEKGELRDLENTDWRFGRFWKGSNITGSINPGRKKAIISFQKNFW
ncbi:hypothetical protein HY500_00445 [Candidatus Woesearchaeota archaeon]|nr:hypothetical protein [Candidatus Woesearchaeota archaeon]